MGSETRTLPAEGGERVAEKETRQSPPQPRRGEALSSGRRGSDGGHKLQQRQRGQGEQGCCERGGATRQAGRSEQLREP